jgi:hypothetical protein
LITRREARFVRLIVSASIRASALPSLMSVLDGSIYSRPVLGGFHHHYVRV